MSAAVQVGDVCMQDMPFAESLGGGAQALAGSTKFQRNQSS